jgi:hypothetical protein
MPNLISRQTQSFGSCPDYSVTIGGSGAVRFSGYANVVAVGEHAASALRSNTRDNRRSLKIEVSATGGKSVVLLEAREER